MAALLCLCTTARAQTGPFPGQDTVDHAHDTLLKAYADHDYPTLCHLLRPDTSFRGSVHPDQWTIGADAIITKRWLAPQTCAAYERGATPPKTARKIYSIPTHELHLMPDGPVATFMPPEANTRVTGSQAHAVEMGVMEMDPRPGFEKLSRPVRRYVLVWIQSEHGWQIATIDTNAPASSMVPAPMTPPTKAQPAVKQ
jgi:hypothetical protein